MYELQRLCYKQSVKEQFFDDKIYSDFLILHQFGGLHKLWDTPFFESAKAKIIFGVTTGTPEACIYAGFRRYICAPGMGAI